MPHRTRHALTLTAARGLLTAVGVGERELPDPALVKRAGPAVLLPRPNDLLPAQRRLAMSPLRSSRVGPLKWDATVVKQMSPVTCGALSFLVMAAAGDPVLATWLTTGRRVGTTPPPEIERLSRVELALPTVAERLGVAEKALHARIRRRALGPFDWPEAFGTPPWGAAREARFRGVRFTHTPVHDRDVATTRRILETVLAATRAGIPVPLYSGGDLSKGLDTAVPRHVVLALPHRSKEPRLRIFESSAGKVFDVPVEALLARTRPLAALGHWTHLVWAVLPESAYGRG